MFRSGINRSLVDGDATSFSESETGITESILGKFILMFSKTVLRCVHVEIISRHMTVQCLERRCCHVSLGLEHILGRCESFLGCASSSGSLFARCNLLSKRERPLNFGSSLVSINIEQCLRLCSLLC